MLSSRRYLMQVKICGSVYNSKDTPIAVSVSPEEKQAIRDSEDDEMVYVSYPEGVLTPEGLEWMSEFPDDDDEDIEYIFDLDVEEI
jgi:hypothetical protein